MAQMTQLGEAPAEQGLPPWQFFLLCGMLAATSVVIVATGQSIANIIILSLTVVAGWTPDHVVTPVPPRTLPITVPQRRGDALVVGHDDGGEAA